MTRPDQQHQPVLPLIPGPFNIQFAAAGLHHSPCAGRKWWWIRPRSSTPSYELMRLSNPRRLGDGRFQMMLLGETGRLYTIQWSETLSNWVGLVTLTNRTGATNVIDPRRPTPTGASIAHRNGESLLPRSNIEPAAVRGARTKIHACARRQENAVLFATLSIC
jgi:hypothetical protein